MATNRIHVNNFSTTLNGAITNSATSIVITSATGLPTLTGSQYYHLTIDDGTNVEVVKVTARTSNTLTVTRGEDGTSGTAFADGTRIEGRLIRDGIDSKLPDDEDVLPDTTSMYDLGSSLLKWVDLHLSGNVNVDGTVDGRDVATDGTKLDTIETNADVTDATNVDAAGAVMNTDTSTTSMSFVIDEDSFSSDLDTKVPTQQSVKAYVDTAVAGVGGGISNVVEDTTPQLGGDLDLNGNNIDFPTTANISDCIDDDTMATASATKLATSESIKAYVDAQVATAGSGWKLLSSATASASSSIDFDNVFDGTYKAYKLVIDGLNPATDDTSVRVVLGTGSTPTYQTGASDYQWEINLRVNGSGVGVTDTADASISLTGIAAGYGVGNAAAEAYNGIVYIFNPSNTSFYTLLTHKGVYSNGYSNTGVATGGGAYKATTAVTSIRVVQSSGNLTVGDFRLYGLTES